MISDLLRESGWELTTIGEVAEINPRKPKYEGLKDDAPVGFIPMAAVDETRGVVTSVEERTLGELRGRSYRTFAPDDVLFAKITPCMENGKAAVVPRLPSGHGFGSTEFHVLRPSRRVDGRYLWHFVRQETYRREAERHMTGSVGQLRVPAEFIRDTQILLPPLSEQRQIVDILDQIQQGRGAAAASMTRVRNIMMNFRRAILAGACSGQLTEGWREGNRLEPVEGLLIELRSKQSLNKRRGSITPPNESALPELPGTWAWACVGEVAEVQVGGTPSRKLPEYWGGKIPWVSSGEVANCRISATREGITEAGLANSNAKIYPVGTVLIAMIGEGKTRGQAAILDIEAANNQNAAGVLPNAELVDPEYLWRWALAQYEVTRAVGRGGNQPALNAQKVRELIMPVPPLEEQREIVRRVDEMLRINDEVLTKVSEASSLLERTNQSALAKAFRGELISQ